MRWANKSSSTFRVERWWVNGSLVFPHRLFGGDLNKEFFQRRVFEPQIAERPAAPNNRAGSFFANVAALFGAKSADCVALISLPVENFDPADAGYTLKRTGDFLGWTAAFDENARCQPPAGA